MTLKQILQSVELFDGLSDSELDDIASICSERRLQLGDTITTQGQPGDEMFIVCEGFVEVGVKRSGQPGRVVFNLGPGQVFGEKALLDPGPHTNSVRAASSPTVVQAISCDRFEGLCERNHHLGYMFMRNLAADLSFKLRHRNLTER